ncbi:MAG TPA: hypothetical protein VMV69_09260 [Pirellulales bacterium]|nr:hypothetical protein [Pirellulales bacterium]
MAKKKAKPKRAKNAEGNDELANLRVKYLGASGILQKFIESVADPAAVRRLSDGSTVTWHAGDVFSCEVSLERVGRVLQLGAIIRNHSKPKALVLWPLKFKKSVAPARVNRWLTDGLAKSANLPGKKRGSQNG